MKEVALLKVVSHYAGMGHYGEDYYSEYLTSYLDFQEITDEDYRLLIDSCNRSKEYLVVTKAEKSSINDLINEEKSFRAKQEEKLRKKNIKAQKSLDKALKDKLNRKLLRIKKLNEEVNNLKPNVI